MFYTDNSITEPQIRDMEVIILLKLKWEVLSVTAYDFLRPILYRIRLNPAQLIRVTNRARFLIDICCLEEILIPFKPVMVALSCIIIRYFITDFENL